MPLRHIEVIAEARYSDAIRAIAERFEVLDYHAGAATDGGRRNHAILIGRGDRQGLLDELQALLGESAAARIIISSVEATIPAEEEERESEEEAARRQRQEVGATREELYNQIAQGAELDRTYMLLTVLSTVVAAIGLIEDNVAAVIGALVIAPLLGPNLAFSFGVALGDGKLMLRALATCLAGLGTAALLGGIVGISGAFDLDAPELLKRTRVGLDGIVLALASGAAAALSITSGLSSALVGVMVAVALMLPMATVGLMLGAGRMADALGALLLLAVNVASVSLGALVVFLSNGIKPRTWLEQRAARQSSRITVAVCGFLLALFAVIILIRQPV